MAESHGNLTIAEIARLAADSPAPGYYVSYDLARRIVTEIRKGSFSVRNSRRRQMWFEIERKVASFERRGHPTHRAVAIVLTSALASSFFISPHRARHIAETI